MRLHTPLSILGITATIALILGATVIAAPVSPPPGGYTGGIFSYYFKNIIEGSGSIVGTTSAGVCPPGKVITGFSTGTATYGLPICSTTTSDDGAASSLTGSLRGTVNYVPKYGLTNTGLINSLIFDNGTNVGIGTSTGAVKLSVLGGIRALGGSTFAGANGYTFSSPGDTDGGIFSPADGTLVFATNNAERVRITSNGNVGIGTTAPGARLDVNADIRVNGVNIGKGSGSIISNTSLGRLVLTANTTGVGNTGIGNTSLDANTTGNNNTAVGGNSLTENTTGANNTAVGVGALTNSIAGNNNTAVGFQSLNTYTGGAQNTALGYRAAWNQIAGDNNIAIGSATTLASLTGSNQLNIGNWIYGNGGNIGIGTSAPSQRLSVVGNTLSNNYMVASGDGNGVCFWGNCTTYKISMGNTAEYHYGSVTDYSIKNTMNNASNRGWTWGANGITPTAALSTQGNMQIAGTMTATQFIGNATTASGVAWTGVSGKPTTAAGYGITDVVTTSGNQTIAGTKTFSSTISGSITGNAGTATALQTARTINGVSFNGTANITINETDPKVGSLSLNYLPRWSGSTLRNSIIYDNGTNVGIGTASPTSKLTVVGGDATINTITVGKGNNNFQTNTAIGYQSLLVVTNSGLPGNAANQGYFNTAIGYRTLSANTIGQGNTALGYNSMLNSINGSYNTANGVSSLSSNTTGDRNTAIGYSAGYNLILGDNNIAIGYGTAFPSTSGSNQLNIGNWIYGSNGNIGIGTGANLTAKLTLQGKLKVVDGTQGGGKILTSDADGLASWETPPADLPIGTVMAFNSTSCPAGWAVANGTAGTPDLRGEFVRGLDMGRGADTGRVLGSWQAPSLLTTSIGPDALQDIVIETTPNATTNIDFYNGTQTDPIQDSWYGTGFKGSAHINGTTHAYSANSAGITVNLSANRPINGNAFFKAGGTRPRNVALLYCMKMTSYATPGDPNTWSNTTGTSSGNVTLATTGRVGVGTNTPTEKLEVVGSIKMVDGNQGANKVLTSDADGKGSWQSLPADLPIGTVMAFNSTSCPAGWAISDGVNGPDLRGEFIRGYDPTGTGRQISKTNTGASTAVGSWQAQDWKGFYMHNTVRNAGTYSHDNVNMGKSTTAYVGNIFAGFWQAPGTGIGLMWDSTSEIRPRNVALLYCIKMTTYATPGDPSTWQNLSGTASGNVSLATTGNVGVGTLTPTEKLEVAGSVKIVDGTQGTGKVLVSDGVGKGTWQEMPGDLPIGTVMAFNDVACPAGWVIANGTNGTPDLRGEFIRGLDSGRGVDTGRVLGSTQQATHIGRYFTNLAGAISVNIWENDVSTLGNLNTGYTTPAGSANNGNLYPTFATRPRNVALLYCMKITVASPELSNNVTWMNVDGTSSGRVSLATTGNVGVGTATPTEKLEVAGSVKIVDGNQGAGKVLVSDNAGKGTWQEMPGDLPYGTIMAFNGSICPAGWVIADGTAGTPDLRGEFIRGLDSGRGVDTGRVLGSQQRGSLIMSNVTAGTDFRVFTLQGAGSITDTLGFDSVAGNINPSATYRWNQVTGAQGVWGVGNPDPNYVGATRPRNVALLHCMKISGVPASMSNSGTWLNMDGTSSGRIVLATTGNVGIGTSNPTYKLHTTGGDFYLSDAGTANVDANIVYSSGGYLNLQNGGGNNTQFRSKNGTITVTVSNSGSISTSDSIYAGAFYYSSDINLKKNLKKITGAVEKLQKLNGYMFDWKRDGTSDIGVIAQEVEQVFPELVEEKIDSATGNKYKTVQYGNLVAPIIEAIKELASQVKSLHTLIEEQQSEIRKLQSENAELKSRLDAIEAKLGISSN